MKRYAKWAGLLALLQAPALMAAVPERWGLNLTPGVTETTVRNWERRGIADAKYGAAKRLARALGVPMEDLEEEE